MKAIKFAVLALGLSALLVSCHDKPVVYQNRVAQDLNYRLGKWYSASDVGINLSTYDARLDTIWFINDTLAGWTGFKSDQHEYVFRKTYFDKTHYNIIYLAPDNQDTTKVDTITHQCAMNATQDTFTIYWNFWSNPPQTESYVKMK